MEPDPFKKVFHYVFKLVILAGAWVLIFLITGGLIIAHGIGKTELSMQLGLSTRTIAKIGKGENLSNRSLRG
ncbi:MAG: hypothetical protein IKS48_08385 [Eubacterium sp.]|nr:hypothetical protein [Eubacterium sp.]